MTSPTVFRARLPAVWGAVCGLLAAGAAMGVAQLLAGLTDPAASPVVAVGQAAIDLTPLPVKTWATSTFGTADKTVLLAGVFVVVFGCSLAVGAAAARRLAAGFAGLTVFAALGLAAAFTRPAPSPVYALPTVGGALAGAFALYRLITAARKTAAARAARWHAASSLPPIEFGTAGPGPDSGQAGPEAPGAPGAPGLASPPGLPSPPGSPSPAGLDAGPARRSFLVTAGVTAAAAAVSEIAGRTLATRQDVSAAQAAIRFPRPAVAAPPLPAGINPPVPGISSFITSNSKFYRVDTALLIPQVDPHGWQLRIHGMVAREITVTFDDLLRRPLIEDYVTLCCVSNPVGGPYVGNAKWLGASLASLIRAAGPRHGADQLLCTSVDGFTSGVPLPVVLDGRDALVAVAMNGAALPTAHGFPARLVVPGLYGYVSACKWVTDIEVTTYASAVAYWAQRGWSQRAPVKTESRIDVPGPGAQVKAGTVAVAGVAWAQHKGIEAVEVRVDHGPWHQAALAAVPGIDCWRQWVWHWEHAAPGQHLIEARATDKTGYTQTSAQTPEAPNGATGYPSVHVTVT